MKVTHYFYNNNGHLFFGTWVNKKWFFALCDDGITWMKEPICIQAGVRSNYDLLNND